MQYDTPRPTRPLARDLQAARWLNSERQGTQMSFSAYLFDYNGVLVDDEEVHWAAFREVLRPMGIEMTQSDYWEKYLGFDDVGAFRAVLKDHHREIDEAIVRQLVEFKKPAYLGLAKGSLRGFDGAGALLRRLAATTAPIGIVSGALRDEIHLGLDVLDAGAAVRFIVSAEDTQASKPDPEGYIIGKTQLAAIAGADIVKRTLVIEDSIAGIESAVAAGLFCLAVAHSYDANQLVAAGALDVVARISDISDDFLGELAKKAGLP